MEEKVNNEKEKQSEILKEVKRLMEEYQKSMAKERSILGQMYADRKRDAEE